MIFISWESLQLLAGLYLCIFFEAYVTPRYWKEFVLKTRHGWLKGTVSRDVLLRKFAEIFASQGAPPVSTTPVSNCRRYQRHQRQILPPVLLVLLTPVANLPSVTTTPVANCRWYQRHRRQICHRYQRHQRQILPPVPHVLLTPEANLPSVTTTQVANCHRYQRHRRQI